MPDLEGGTSIILIPLETFRLPETQIELPHFELEEGTAYELPPRSSRPQERSGVGKLCGVLQILLS
jgi:hypothetical protein